MPESAAHMKLVEHLVRWVRENVPMEKALLLADSPYARSGDKPFPIGGYFPDVYCRVHDGEIEIIGEAKAAGDLDNRHTRDQLCAYLAHLQKCQSGALVLAAPWFVINQGKTVLRALQRTTACGKVRLVFMEQLPG